MTDIVRSDFLRVWTIEGGAAPGNSPVYQGCFKPGDFTQSFGDVTRIECPDPDQYGAFVEVGEVPGQVERPTMTLMGRYPMDVSDLLRLARKGCRIDVHVHVGKCRDPRDFNGGWEKKVIFPASRITNYGTENFGALASDERNPVNESADISAREVYELARVSFAEKAGSTVAREIIAIRVCDTPNCGEDCGDESNGCQKIFAVQIGSGATTPGTVPSVVWSDDGGATWDTSLITTLFANETPTGAECVGEYFVVTSNIPNSLHYALIEDILDGTETWTEIATGLVAGGEPNAISSVSPRHTWIVGDGGYIYFTDNPTSGVEVQDAGVATTQDLNAVHALDEQNVLVVGNSNAVVSTENGGETWQAITGPSAAVNLTSVWMKSSSVWLVGNASGDLWYTRNSGASWTEIGLPITPTQIEWIEFVDDTVGYLSATIAGPAGRILRSTDGGESWYVLPEGAGAIPANNQINALAVCKQNPNVVFGGGLGDNGTDGIIVQAA